jgi:hypothetical protein
LERDERKRASAKEMLKLLKPRVHHELPEEIKQGLEQLSLVKGNMQIFYSILLTTTMKRMT